MHEMITDYMLAGAREYYAWYRAYVETGFTEEQAMAILLKPSIVVNASGGPEVAEFFTKATALFNRDLAEP